MNIPCPFCTIDSAGTHAPLCPIKTASSPEAQYTKRLQSELEAAYEKIKELEQNNSELEFIFDLRHKADQRAVKRWRESTGRELTIPDHADLCVYLIEQVEKLNELIDWISEHKQCEWKSDSNGIWHTRCGNTFEFMCGGVAENKADFCQYCGSKICLKGY